jgi:hypothetical protein
MKARDLLDRGLAAAVRDAAKRLPLMVSFTQDAKGKLRVVAFTGGEQGCSDKEEDPAKALMAALAGVSSDDF